MARTDTKTTTLEGVVIEGVSQGNVVNIPKSWTCLRVNCLLQDFLFRRVDLLETTTKPNFSTSHDKQQPQGQGVQYDSYGQQVISTQPNGNSAAVGVGAIMPLALHDSTTFHITRNDSISSPVLYIKNNHLVICR